jgi:transposase-like protein
MNLLAAGDIEVSAKAQRRIFSGADKRRILEEADACVELGALGALLRREGIYSSYLTAWRRQRDRGELAGLAPKKRGRKMQVVDARDRKIAELQRENSRLTARAEKAEAIVEIQKKLGQLFGVQMPENPDPTRKP